MSKKRTYYLMIPAVTLFLLGFFLSGCVSRGIRPDRAGQEQRFRLTATGYCKCGSCCGWKRNWLGRPVYAYGKNKGRRKQVGITASGTRARPGSLAADTSIFPFGTVMHIPGYGYGRVEDRGGAIRGLHIDLYFNSHQQALEWGRQIKTVRVWLPR